MSSLTKREKGLREKLVSTHSKIEHIRRRLPRKRSAKRKGEKECGSQPDLGAKGRRGGKAWRIIHTDGYVPPAYMLRTVHQHERWKSARLTTTNGDVPYRMRGNLPSPYSPHFLPRAPDARQTSSPRQSNSRDTFHTSEWRKVRLTELDEQMNVAPTRDAYIQESLNVGKCLVHRSRATSLPTGPIT